MVARFVLTSVRNPVNKNVKAYKTLLHARYKVKQAQVISVVMRRGNWCYERAYILTLFHAVSLEVAILLYQHHLLEIELLKLNWTSLAWRYFMTAAVYDCLLFVL